MEKIKLLKLTQSISYHLIALGMKWDKMHWKIGLPKH